MFTELKAGDRTYKLRLTTQGVIQLEKDLGCSPLQMLMGIDDDLLPKVTDLVTVLHRTLQPFEHGISVSDTYGILDDFIADGNTIWDILPIIIDVFKDAGFLPKDEDDLKN